MAKFTIKCFNKVGEEMKLQALDLDVCALWGVAPHEEKWAIPPNHDYSDNWQKFIVSLIYFSMPESGVATIDKLIEHYLKNKDLLQNKFEFMEHVKKDIYIISLLLYFKKLNLFFTIQYTI